MSTFPWLRTFCLCSPPPPPSTNMQGDLGTHVQKYPQALQLLFLLDSVLPCSHWPLQPCLKKEKGRTSKQKPKTSGKTLQVSPAEEEHCWCPPPPREHCAERDPCSSGSWGGHPFGEGGVTFTFLSPHVLCLPWLPGRELGRDLVLRSYTDEKFCDGKSPT